MKNKKSVWAAVLLLVLAVGTGGAVLWRNTAKEKETEYLSASWSYHYADIEEISQASDLIALVRVTETEDTVVEYGIPYTTFSVEVLTPVYNAEEGGSFTIYMTGGETEDKIMEIADDPLLREGDEVLVFCRQNPDGTYQILSGPQGRLVYSDGKLNSINVVNERAAAANTASNIKVQNADADALIEEIRGYVGAAALNQREKQE